MIIGSGLVANGFNRAFKKSKDICIYAAGVSRSSCVDQNEFNRERQRLIVALHESRSLDCFVYFSTCSVADKDIRIQSYVTHKVAMEKLVAKHPRHLIFRLPQIAGVTHNPYTLLNFLYARIVGSESFELWTKAYRNIIDLDDMVELTSLIIEDVSIRNITINIANPVSYSITDIVRLMESAIGKPAIYKPIECGSKYEIDLCMMKKFLSKSKVTFGENYLKNVIGKYYGHVDKPGW